jgi:hypothetical protein
VTGGLSQEAKRMGRLVSRARGLCGAAPCMPAKLGDPSL